MPSVRVLLADLHPIFRTGLRLLLNETPDVRVVGEAASGAQALWMAEELAPDVLLSAADFSDLTAADVARHLRERKANVKVLVLSAYSDAASVRAALDAGAAGYLTKDETPERLLAAVCGVACGERHWLSPRAVAVLSERVPEREEELSPREVEVLHLIAVGLENKEIAAWLTRAEGMIKNHVDHLMEKLGARTRAHAVWLGVCRGLLPSPEAWRREGL